MPIIYLASALAFGVAAACLSLASGGNLTSALGAYTLSSMIGATAASLWLLRNAPAPLRR